MEYSEFGLQCLTSEYERYVYDLPQAVRDDLIPNQDLLYKNIDPETSAKIYDLLYRRSVGGRDFGVRLFVMTEVRDIEAVSDACALGCHQRQAEEPFVYKNEVVILGTGYKRPTPTSLEPLKDAIDWDEQGQFGVAKDHRLTVGTPGDAFLQNAEAHTYGVRVPDLGLGCYQSTRFVNRFIDRGVYPDNVDTVFQDFLVVQFPDHVSNASHAERSETPPTSIQNN